MKKLDNDGSATLGATQRRKSPCDAVCWAWLTVANVAAWPPLAITAVPIVVQLTLTVGLAAFGHLCKVNVQLSVAFTRHPAALVKLPTLPKSAGNVTAVAN